MLALLLDAITKAILNMSTPGTREDKATASQTDEELDRMWNVLVWNDPVNGMDYVIFVFQRIFGYTVDLARKLMLEVHHEGKSLVASEPREKAEMYVSQLHQYGWQATMERQEG